MAVLFFDWTRHVLLLFQTNCILTLQKYSSRDPQLVVNKKKTKKNTMSNFYFIYLGWQLTFLYVSSIEKILFQLNQEITSLFEQRKITLIEIFDYLLKWVSEWVIVVKIWVRVIKRFKRALELVLYVYYVSTLNKTLNLNLNLKMVFKATFNNISVISWRSVLLVEETGVPI